MRTRTTILQAFTHQWIGTYSGAGNGKYRNELKRALEAITWYATALSLPLSQVLVRLDGLYGNAAPLTDVLQTGLGVIARSKDYTLLDLPIVKATLARSPVEECTHPESQTYRALFDCAEVPLTPTGPTARLIVAAHQASSSPPSIGVERAGTVYELFVTVLPSPAFSPKDVLDLHRGSFETVLADEEIEQAADRWCSHTPCGQEFWQILNQWVWNVRLELGQHLSPAEMRTTEFAPAFEASSAPATQLAPATQPAPTTEVYGPPQWARRSFTGGFPGSAFPLQPDGSLLCPANHPLYPQERRMERDGSLRLLYAARIGDCRTCALRVRCQESVHTTKPRRVSAVFWPATPTPAVSSIPVAALPQAPPTVPKPIPRFPVLWQDWPRCQIRRQWLKVVRSETVVVAMETTQTQKPMAVTSDQMITRTQRAHWRLSWHERFTRNARRATAVPLTVTIHGLPVTFAHLYGFPLLEAA